MKHVASPNFNDRAPRSSIQYIVLHYTAMEPAEKALERLCDPQHEVSAHYMIDCDGEIIQLVQEDKRAWHAGESFWKGKEDINSRSIGIELVNTGHKHFPQPQIESLKTLLKEIMQRQHLKAPCLLGHSDIAPTRKKDPDIFFPWKELAREGFDLFPRPDKQDYAASSEGEVSALLREIGYACTDKASKTAALTAFHRRYYAEKVDGEKVDGEEDSESLARLRALVRMLG